VRAAELALQHGKPYFEVLQATPGETQETWRVFESPVAPTTAPAAEPAPAEQLAEVVIHESNSVLLIRLLNTRTPAALDARDILRDASRKGIALPAATRKRLNARAQES
jgi:hypothetical protein